MEPNDPHDRATISNVQPPGWVNPRPAERYNLVVMGAGTAGLIAAAGAAGLGAKVALVEKHQMGGDCLNVGCVPSKALIRSSRALADVRDAAHLGVDVPPGARADFAKIMSRMRRLRAEISKNDSAERYRGMGVDVFFGAGLFTGREAAEVDGRRLRFAKAVIATGARAAVPKIPGLRESGYLTNETVFSLTSLPPRLAILGGGPIGCELAQAFARFGAKVSLLQSAGQILPKEDPDCARLIERAFSRDGVELLLNCTALKAERAGDEKILSLECGASARRLAVDEILVATGRSPNVDGLGLEAAGVEYDAKSGVRVDDSLRTTNPNIYAAGDVCLTTKFTHMSDATARIALQNALFLGRKKLSALTIPWCTYTDPEIAHVGMQAQEAEKRGIPVQTFVQKLKDVDRAALDAEEEGFLKVHVRRGTDRILGATLAARHAGDMLSELTLAITAGVGLKAVAETIHPYPTQAECIKKVADAYNRTRLTAGIRRLLGAWMRWSRGGA